MEQQVANAGTTNPATSTATTTNNRPKRERKVKQQNDLLSPRFKNEAEVLAHLKLTERAATNKLTIKDHETIIAAVTPFIKPLRKVNNQLASALYYVGWKHRKLIKAKQAEAQKQSRKKQPATAPAQP